MNHGPRILVVRPHPARHHALTSHALVRQFTLLEEAENERMHLIVCMGFFEAGPVTRAVVQVGQIALTPFLAGLYVIRPQLLHRFVGYLEETAVHTCESAPPWPVIPVPRVLCCRC